MQVYILIKNGKIEGVYASEDDAIRASLEDFDTVYDDYEILAYTIGN